MIEYYFFFPNDFLNTHGDNYDFSPPMLVWWINLMILLMLFPKIELVLHSLGYVLLSYDAWVS